MSSRSQRGHATRTGTFLEGELKKEFGGFPSGHLHSIPLGRWACLFISGGQERREVCVCVSLVEFRTRPSWVSKSSLWDEAHRRKRAQCTLCGALVWTEADGWQHAVSGGPKGKLFQDKNFLALGKICLLWYLQLHQQLFGAPEAKKCVCLRKWVLCEAGGDSHSSRSSPLFLQYGEAISSLGNGEFSKILSPAMIEMDKKGLISFASSQEYARLPFQANATHQKKWRTDEWMFKK